MAAKTAQLKYLAEVTLGKMLQPAESIQIDQEMKPYLKASSITTSGLDLGNLQEMPFSAKEQSHLDLRKNDVVVVEGGSIGRSAYIKEDLPGIHFQNYVNRVRPLSGNDGRYINYALVFLEQSGYFESITDQATISHLTAEKLERVPIPVRSFEEQKRIADKLDRELAEVDDFIADQQHLLELATEKFNAEIRSLTHPEGVETVPLKRFADITLGKMITPSDKGGMELAPYIRAANIQPGGVFTYQSDYKKMWFSSNELSYLDLKKGDVLIFEGGAGFGRSAILTEDLPGWGFQNSINRVQVNKKMADPNFISLSLRTQLLFGDQNSLTNQSTIPHLTAEKLALTRIPNINFDSQKHLSNIIINKSKYFTELFKNISQSTEILDEIRKSKIEQIF
ncbi:restriction endonuclease subunit S [Rothia sp. LK2492]|uniref:restriction endonuclease subunit S n=1 Tax=Rothia sp. LK2492 TaxID=3114370 RepID=UPI0034CE1892